MGKMTRREAVLNYLRRYEGAWVAGMELMNAEVGGTRAGARIWELRQAGWIIERRTSPRSAVDEYRLMGSVDGTFRFPHADPAATPLAPLPVRRHGAAGVTRNAGEGYSDMPAVKVPRTGAHARCSAHVRVPWLHKPLCVADGQTIGAAIEESAAMNGPMPGWPRVLTTLAERS